MQRDYITCPSCLAIISVLSLHVTTGGAAGRAATGTVLKCCPSCYKWTWMNPQPQEAS